MEEDYVTGDIVLLSHSKLGIMTSSTTVREIRGCDTTISRIVKKLTAKELAETVVDFQERYNNLESKSCQHSLKEGNTDSNTTKTTRSYTKYTKSSKTTSSSEPKPKSINNDLDIPKTPNYANHTISPTDSKQHMYYAHHQGSYAKTKRGSDGDTPSTKSNDESATCTTATSTISSLSPHTQHMQDMDRQTPHKAVSKSPKPKKKLFGKIRKNKKHQNTLETVHVPKAKSSRFLFKSKNRKNTKSNANCKKISKRSSSSETHSMRHTRPAHSQPPRQPMNQNVDYMGYPTHEYLPYHHDTHSQPHLPFSHVRSNPDDIIHIERKSNHHLLAPHLQHTNGPKTRFCRSKSTDTYPYHTNHAMNHTSAEHHHLQHRYEYNPYFIAYTPSHNTTPPIPSPNVASYHLPPYAHHYLSPNASSYSSTAAAPVPMQLSPYALYNRYNLHFHPNYYSTPNMDAAAEEEEAKLIDVLLSVPALHKKESCTTPNKKKSHPISYKKRTIKGTHCDGLLMTSRTALTESISPSQSGTPPTYPQQYIPQQQHVLNLLNSPEPPQQSVVDPIMANYSHLKHLQNQSNTMDTEDTIGHMSMGGREREIYLNYNHYAAENSCSQSNAKRDRKIMNQYISSNNNDSMIYNDSTSVRGGSHSPRNSSYSFRQRNKTYHSPRGSHPYHGKRPFSATNKHHKYNNCFDFGPSTHKQRYYSAHTHNKHNNQHAQHSMTKSNTVYSEIEGKNEYSQNKTAVIKPFHPQTQSKKYKKPKLTQHYSSPARDHEDGDYLVHPKKLKQMAYHKQRGKTMGHDINLELGLNNRWLLSSRSKDDEDTEDIENDHETVINHAASSDTNTREQSNKYNEGRKSQSFSVLALGKSLDDLTPLVLSPQSKQHAAAATQARRSQSVANIFDPVHPSQLSDLHEMNLNLSHIRNVNSNGSTIDMNNRKDTTTDTDSSVDDDGERDKNYKIVLHKAYPPHTSVDNRNNLKNVPRFSQSGQSNTSFTPTMSQTPSYLRESRIEDAKWAKSMKISASTRASQCSTESDSQWMLHNQINVNGGTDARRHFFGDNDGFPNIDLERDHHDPHHPNSQLSPTNLIVNQDELQMQIVHQMHLQKRNDNKYKHQLCVSPTSNTSDTDTISKSYIY